MAVNVLKHDIGLRSVLSFRIAISKYLIAFRYCIIHNIKIWQGILLTSQESLVRITLSKNLCIKRNISFR